MPGSFLYATLLPSILSGILIWIWPRKWTNKLRYPQLGESKHQARTALIVLLVIFALTFVLVVVSPGGFDDSHQREYFFGDVIGQAIVWGIVLLPMFIGMKVDGLEWHDLQYSRRNLLPSFVLGTLVGVVFLIGAGKVERLSIVCTASGIYAILQYLVVGFAEETLFRGYVQVRWGATLGWWSGFLLTSVVMSLYHVPLLFMGESLPFSSVLLELLRMMPLSLLLGYAMHRSGNIVAPGIIHLWLNLIQAL